MLKKRHGPAMRVEQVELVECQACRGKAVIKGVFHELACDTCNASGWVRADDGQALELHELVTQLSLRLRAAQLLINKLNKPRIAGPERHYQHSNRLGAGGTNYTGD